MYHSHALSLIMTTWLLQDAMAIVRAKGKPSLFITMTCNENWPERELSRISFKRLQWYSSVSNSALPKATYSCRTFVSNSVLCNTACGGDLNEISIQCSKQWYDYEKWCGLSLRWCSVSSRCTQIKHRLLSLQIAAAHETASCCLSMFLGNAAHVGNRLIPLWWDHLFPFLALCLSWVGAINIVVRTANNTAQSYNTWVTHLAALLAGNQLCCYSCYSWDRLLHTLALWLTETMLIGLTIARAED